MRALTVIACLAVGLYALACVGLWLAQRSLIYYPQPRQHGGPATFIHMDVPGAKLVVSAREMAGKEAVLYFGGNAEDVSGSLPELARDFPSQSVYAPHYRGYGGSSGKPTQEALFADALALFDQLHAKHPNITVIGRSLGSGVAVHLASMRPVARLVLVTPYDSIVEIGAQQFRFMPVRFLMTDKFESWRYAPNVTAPTTIIAAEHDTIIPMASTKQLLTRFRPGVAQLFVVEGTGHNDISDRVYYHRLLTGITPAR